MPPLWFSKIPSGRIRAVRPRAWRPAVGVVTRPNPRDERCREPAAGDEADHEGAKAEALMHVSTARTEVEE